MPLFQFALAGGIVYASQKSYQKLKHPQNLGDILDPVVRSTDPHPIVCLVKQIDQACQQLVREKLDPLLVGSNRQQQMSLLTTSESADFVSEEEKQTNRGIVVAGFTMGLATLGSYLFPPLIFPTIMGGIYLLVPLYHRSYHQLIYERKISLDQLAALFMTGMWLFGYYIFGSFVFLLHFTKVKIIYQIENRSRANLTNLFGQQPRFVWRLVDGVEVKTPFSEIQRDDVIVVNAGEPLPVDGVVIKGLGSVDQHLLTGESQPVEKEVGDEVFAATLLLSGRLQIRVEQAGQNTLTAQIGQILEQTVSHQTEIELKGQELADKTVLPNLAASLIALLVVGPVGAVATLGASIGFNVSLVSMLSTMNYLTIASKNNILIKDGRALERLKDIDTIVFDKTGTLTLDQPHVAQCHVLPQADLNQTDLLRYAATAEYRQPHPIAKAIIRAAEAQGWQLPEIDEASYEVGYGIKVQIQQQLIRVGSGRFMAQQQLTIPPELETLQATCQQEGATLVFVAVDEQVVGAIELQATIRPEAQRVIQQLKHRNLSLAIISGDHEEPTRKLAAKLGIQNYFANTLPENKAQHIKQLQNEGRVVCFIGDGINDAIALKQADVSISLLGATSIATDTAQIVFMDQSLNQLDYLLALTHKYDKTLQTGFMTSVVPGVVCIGGVFVAGFGIYTTEILFQLGLFSGLGVAMQPLLTENNQTNRLTSNHELLTS